MGDTRHITRSYDPSGGLVGLAEQAGDGRVVPGKVTTSLKHPTTPISERRSQTSTTVTAADYLVEQNVKAQKTNGVARSAFARPAARRAKWHRPYVLCLIIADLLCALGASYTAVSIFESDRITAGFDDDRVFLAIAYIGLPLGWLILLWANGAYDRRIVGIGTDEFKRVVRTTIAVTASLGFLAFGLQKGVSRGSVAFVVLVILFGALSRRYT